MGRPRLPLDQLTKAALWKRAHRDNVGDGIKGKCQKCGKTANLSVHHVSKDYGRSGKGKLQKLCIGCHNKARRG